MTRMSGPKPAVAFLMICIATPTMLSAQTVTTLFSFSGSNGNHPQASLVQGIDGNLYGTTEAGGTDFGACNGCGTLFTITPAGALTTLYNFCSKFDCYDGAYPDAPLLLTESGSFYGTAYGGGSVKGNCNNYGCGTAFRIDPAGALSTIHDFCSEHCADGAGPQTALVQAPDGNFYGTTGHGGGSSDAGVVFTMTPAGALTTLYSFCSQPNCPDGELPLAPLVQGADGNFYGTTFSGGNMSNQYPCNTVGCGTIFEITPSGTLTTIYKFCSEPNCTDGIGPSGGLVQGSDGAFYGMTSYGGRPGGNGTVFRITAQGKFRILHSFNGGNGARPVANLIQATDGDLYGTTEGGGGKNGGTLFKITPSGTYSVLYNFCAQINCADGEVPAGGLYQSTNGIIYGTTFLGGSSSGCGLGCGTVFSLSLGLSPFVTFVRAAARVGQTGGILGQGFTGTTSVMVNGIPATFRVVSDTFIQATVPQGATTGYITVTTPSSVLKSNVPFHVIQ